MSFPSISSPFDFHQAYPSTIYPDSLPVYTEYECNESPFEWDDTINNDRLNENHFSDFSEDIFKLEPEIKTEESIKTVSSKALLEQNVSKPVHSPMKVTLSFSQEIKDLKFSLEINNPSANLEEKESLKNSLTKVKAKSSSNKRKRTEEYDNIDEIVAKKARQEPLTIQEKALLRKKNNRDSARDSRLNKAIEWKRLKDQNEKVNQISEIIDTFEINDTAYLKKIENLDPISKIEAFVKAFPRLYKQ